MYGQIESGEPPRPPGKSWSAGSIGFVSGRLLDKEVAGVTLTGGTLSGRAVYCRPCRLVRLKQPSFCRSADDIYIGTERIDPKTPPSPANVCNQSDHGGHEVLMERKNHLETAMQPTIT